MDLHFWDPSNAFFLSESIVECNPLWVRTMPKFAGAEGAFSKKKPCPVGQG